MTIDNPFPPGATLRAYLRDSGGNNQDLSVLQQQAAVEAWCEEYGHVLTHVYADVARPGGSVVGREQFSMMIEYFSSAGKPEAGVVLWDYSRFSRNYDDSQFFLSLLRRNGYTVHSLEQQIPAGAMGKVMESMHIWAAEEYKHELGRKVKRGLHYIVGVHKAYPHAVAPAGYRKYPVQIGLRRNGAPHIIDRLEPDPETAARVLAAFELRAAGQSLPEIHAAVQLLNHRQSYGYMFANEIYRGVFRFGSLRIADYCEPIIPPELWDQVQEVSRSWSSWRTERDQHPRRARSPFLLSGLLRCGLCGWAMVGLRHGQGKYTYPYYSCGRRSCGADGAQSCQCALIRMDQIDRLVVDKLLEYLTGDNYLQAIVDALRAELSSRPELPSPADDLRAKLTETAAGKARLVAAIVAGGELPALVAELARMEEAEARQRQELAKAEAGERKRLALVAGLDPVQAQRAALDARLQLEQPDFRSRQLALRGVIKTIRAVRLKGERRISGEIVAVLPGTDIETMIPLG